MSSESARSTRWGAEREGGNRGRGKMLTLLLIIMYLQNLIVQLKVGKGGGEKKEERKRRREKKRRRKKMLYQESNLGPFAG